MGCVVSGFAPNGVGGVTPRGVRAEWTSSFRRRGAATSRNIGVGIIPRQPAPRCLEVAGTQTRSHEEDVAPPRRFALTNVESAVARSTEGPAARQCGYAASHGERARQPLHSPPERAAIQRSSFRGTFASPSKYRRPMESATTSRIPSPAEVIQRPPTFQSSARFKIAITARMAWNVLKNARLNLMCLGEPVVHLRKPVTRVIRPGHPSRRSTPTRQLSRSCCRCCIQ
jgi:hypothetical protein